MTTTTTTVVTVTNNNTNNSTITNNNSITEPLLLRREMNRMKETNEILDLDLLDVLKVTLALTLILTLALALAFALALALALTLALQNPGARAQGATTQSNQSRDPGTVAVTEMGAESWQPPEATTTSYHSWHSWCASPDGRVKNTYICMRAKTGAAAAQCTQPIELPAAHSRQSQATAT